MVRFGIVDPSQGWDAYQWHRGFAGNGDCVYPRPWSAFESLVTSEQVLCARDTDGDYVALTYYTLDAGKWEIGGLMVATPERKKGVGGTIARLTVGYVLLTEDPLPVGQSVIAHIHEANDMPRPLFELSLKFRKVRQVSYPGEQLAGLKTNADGMVVGDELEIVVPDTLEALAKWCDAWKGKLKDGSEAKIVLGPGPDTDLKEWARAFRDMAKLPKI